MRPIRPFFLLAIILVLNACTTRPAAGPTAAPPATTAPPTAAAESAAAPVAVVPPTWTAAAPGSAAATSTVPPSRTAPPSRTPSPTTTPWLSQTSTATLTLAPTLLPSQTPTPTLTATPTATPTWPPTPTPPLLPYNYLPNPSFEEGWYHINNIPELQVPAQWTLQWDEGANPLDPDPWNAFVRPESRVLTRDFLPPGEHELFIWDGDQTVKIFKGHGALSFRLGTGVQLEPGRYLLTTNVFPDLVVDYADDGSKIYADDPLSGEVRLLVDERGTPWLLPVFGQRNSFAYEFVVTEPAWVQLGIAIRGRWAILNNGWFLDDFGLYRIIE